MSALSADGGLRLFACVDGVKPALTVDGICRILYHDIATSASMATTHRLETEFLHSRAQLPQIHRIADITIHAEFGADLCKSEEDGILSAR